jgi:hypothetical protein
MEPVLRFAPSPTGLIHIGNARTALLNALVARREAGTFVLRFDDTDAERSREEYAEQTEADLTWLGIPPDLVVRQSDRMALYDEAAERLKAAGRLYPCYETPEELERRRRIQLARGQPPIYDRAALSLTDDERRALEEGDGGRTGASGSSCASSSGTTMCAGSRMSIAGRSPTLSWCARTGPISTRCPPSSTTSRSASRMSFAVRTT